MIPQIPTNIIFLKIMLEKATNPQLVAFFF